MLARYLARRAITAFLVIVIVMAFLATLDRLIPGNPVTFIYGPHASPQLIRQVRREMGLNVSVPVQILNYIGNAFTGNLGTDFVTGHSVASQVAMNLKFTVVLALSGLGFAVLVGVPLGVVAATKPGGIVDRVIGLASISVITVPAFVAGLLLILVFAVQLGWFPVIGAGNPGQPLDDFRHLVLPAVALSLGWIGYIARLVRSNMLEVLTANYVRTAHAFGIRRNKIFYKYALKNAAAPVVAVLGVGLGSLLGGAIFIEVIFDRPGLGLLAYNAIASRNFPIVQGTALVIAVIVILANLLADITYRLLDSRIQLGQTAAA
ncbi:MAG: ABC transporter permease [Acidimicrobiales bacterium]